MKFLQFGKKKKKEIVLDFYQNSINRIGKAQIKKIVERGLSMPVVSVL